jgi:FkbH-like protein
MDTYMPFTNNVKSQVKLVIWDLDETFWKGTLSEEGIESVTAHVDMVRSLVDRGVMCSICSKNDFEQGKAALEKLGIWDLFVFPHIAWSPKGQAIAQMIEDMGLRDENVLFLDDNNLNLEEAVFFSKNLMVVDASKGDLTELLNLPQLQGKDDRNHSRLAQYKVMEQKKDERENSGLSNANFLRQSQIKIKIITDVENHMDRVLEILNRTNQLNFTKVRASSSDERAKLDELLAISGMHAGLIQVQDRYGDYGVVGFFCVRTKFSGTTVHHFAFSCRTLNMGVEQWVWQYLGRPEFDVVGPVASRLNEPDQVDWISEVTDFESATNQLEERRLCLVGGCDLLQVSFYCGTNRDEFVNKPDDNGTLVRYDDVGFILNPRDKSLKHSFALKYLVGQSYDDMLAFDRSVQEADLILLSLYFSVPSDLFFTYGGKEWGGEYWATIPPRRFKKLMKDPDLAARFAKEMFHRRLPLEERIGLTRRGLERVEELRRPASPIFLLSAPCNNGEQAERTRDIREAYNAMCRDFCDTTENAHFIDIDALLSPEEFVDSDHYTRTGYFKIAEFVNTFAKTDELQEVA